MDKNGLQELYLDYLKEKGYKASIEEDGDIAFKDEGDKYFISIDENDIEYFRICSGYGWEFKSDEDKTKALQVANSLNGEYKLGKIFLDIEEEIVMLDAGFFLIKPDDFRSFFERCLRIIQSMMSDFSDKMKEKDN